MQEDGQAAPAPQAGTGTPPDKPLTHLGKAMEQVRLASRQSLNAFLGARDIPRKTYYRLAYNHKTVPRPLTVRQIAEKIGLDPAEALRLRQLDIDERVKAGTRKSRTLTPLGELMEEARLATGQSITDFYAARGVPRTRYYELAYETTKPNPTTVLDVAQALGLDRREALRRTGYDPDLADSAPVQQPPADGDSATAAAP